MAGSAYLWDSCVLYRWLNGTHNDYVDHIGKYLEESKSRKIGLYISTIALAEIRPSAVNRAGLSPIQILSEISSSFILIDTSPDIMSLAGYLRDQTYQFVDGPIKDAARRPLGTGDAIQLAAAIALREEFGVQNLAFHTFDEGKRKDSVDGKSVPLIGYKNWCRGCAHDEEVQKVIAIPRKKPDHPLCPLPKTNPK